MIFLNVFLRLMIMNKKLLIFLSMLCIFFYVDDVKAETNYYTDDGYMFRLVFDDTPLRNFVKRDFAFVYDDKDNRKHTIALFEKNYKNYKIYAGYKLENDLLITIYETREAYQNSTNIKYVVNITPELMVGTSSSIMLPKNYNDNYVVLGDDGKYTIYSGTYWSTSNGSGLDFLNLEAASYTRYNNYNVGWTQESYGGVTLIVDTEGNVQRIVNIFDNYNDLVVEIRDYARTNIFYSSHDIYDKNKNLITPKEEFETRNITSNYSLTCDEENPYIYDLNFNISDLKTNDNVVISYNSNSILLNETLTEQKNSFSIENAKTGNYHIKVYDDSGELIHENSFYIKVDSDVQIDVSDEDININSDDDVSTILNKNNIFLNKALVIVTPLIQIVVTFYNNLPTFLKLALISIFISLLIYLLVRRLT